MTYARRNDKKVGAAIELVAALSTLILQLPPQQPPPAVRAPTATNAGRSWLTSTFGPRSCSQQVSAIFGGYGPVDDLILDPLWAKLVPTNALGLGTEPGTYG